MVNISAVAGIKSGNAIDMSLPHVLLVVDQFPKTLGGGERIVLRLAALLPNYGYRVSILTFFVHPDCAAIATSPCPIHILPLQCTYDVNAFCAAFEFRRFLKLQRVRIVQTFFESSDIWAGFVTKVASSAKLIWSRRDMGILRDSKHQVAYRLMSGLPDAVFAVSEQVRRHCIEVDRIDPLKVHTIYNGLDLTDTDVRTRPIHTDNHVRIVTLGNIRKVKGHDLFIRAAAIVRQRYPFASFHIAGEILETDYFAKLQTLVHELNLTDHFHFAGEISDTRKYMSEADIFVLPSRSEGFSNAIIEAMAASLPVVCTAVGGNAEAVVDGVTGFIVPPEDSDALAVSIVRLLEDPLRAEAMGIAGRVRVKEIFTTEAMMDAMVTEYSLLI